MMKKASVLYLAIGVVSTSAFTFSSTSQNVQTSRRCTSRVIVPPISISSSTITKSTQLYATGSDPDEEIAIIHRNADATFAVIDVDGGGTLSKSEFTNHLSVSGYNIETIDKIFNKMDVNKDEEISREEFRDGMVMLVSFVFLCIRCEQFLYTNICAHNIGGIANSTRIR